MWKKIKGKDLFDIVWRNLEEYSRLGCGVVLKYIMKNENCADSELHAFIERAVRVGPREIILDIDYDFLNPDDKIVNALRTPYLLYHLHFRIFLSRSNADRDQWSRANAEVNYVFV